MSTTSTSSTTATTSTTPTSSSSNVQVPALKPSFSPTSSCTQDIYYVVRQDVSCVDSNGSTVPCREFHLGPTTSTSACFPTSWSPSSGAYISPGGCPLGYTVACARTEEPERTATCCPSGYSCQTQSSGFPWYTTELCVQSMPDSITYYYTTFMPGKDPQTYSTTGGGTLNAFGVDIRWHQTDLATSTNPPISTDLATPTPTPFPTSTSTSVLSSSGLSPGTMAGIGIGAAAGILVLVSMFLLWRRWRKRRLESKPAIMYDPQLVDNFQPVNEVSELPCYSEANTFGSTPPAYYHTERSELSGRSLPAELGPGRE
ncbi:hypothetical protein F4781DRAFT_184399 [Annulohypoxylon bovei var. microspora]|nr:hypothetical protein F4781DRAFT_184399 [Annulohypoxylon bovei var. microspora]